MKQDTKKTIVLISLIALYILVGVLGIYEMLGLLLFPILSIPLAVYVIRNEQKLGIHFLYNIIIMIGIYLGSQSIQSILVYLVGICVPTYTLLFLYKKRLPLPNIIMYTGLIITAGMFIYFMLMKQLGVDYEVQFILMLDEIKAISIENLNEIFKASGLTGTASPEELQQLFVSMVDTIKLMYPALVLLEVFFLTIIQVLLVNSILRIKNKTLPSIKQFLEFKISKVAIVILFIAMMGINMSTSLNNGWITLCFNVMVVLTMLLNVIGVLAIVALIRKTAINKMFKILGYVMVVFLFITSPTILMLLGCLDTIFNYRKVKIIV